jgi:hypothetical protein
VSRGEPDGSVRVEAGDVLAFLRVRELSWHDLVLPEDTIAVLRDFCSKAAEGGLVAVATGERGVGKTIAVQTCAEQLRLDTWRVDCRLLVERHGEDSAAALPAVLATGERPHAVLLFHDVEWLFERGAGDAGPQLIELAGSRRPPTILETCSPELVGGPPLHGLPHVAVPFPDEHARAELWRRLAWQAHPLLEPDIAVLAAVPAPAASIELALDLALGLALDRALDGEGAELPTTSDLLRSLRQL